MTQQDAHQRFVTSAPSAVHQLAHDLSNLPDDLVLAVVEEMLTLKRVSVSHAPLATMLRLTLRDLDDDASLVGPPRALFDDTAAAFVDLGIRTQAMRAVLDVEMLTSGAVAQALGLVARNPREAASRLRRDGTLLGVPQPGSRSYVFPAFQIDPARARIHPVVAEVNKVMSAARDPWGVASWWISVNDRLDEGQAPMDLVGTDVEDDLRVMVGLLAPSRASDATA